MKYVKILTIFIIVCSIFSACDVIEDRRCDHLGFEITDYTIVEEEDTHGGFHGDGSYYLILDCSKNSSQVHEAIKEWKELPLSDNLDLVMYGGEIGGVNYAYNFAEDAHLPTIQNGVYKFVDRHSSSVDQSDDTNLLDRASFNFSIAVYDLDTDTMYYFEKDT